MKLLLLN